MLDMVRMLPFVEAAGMVQLEYCDETCSVFSSRFGGFRYYVFFIRGSCALIDFSTTTIPRIREQNDGRCS
jgi:hypothetical protein